MAYRLFTDAGGRHANAGLTPYALNAPLFSDYAEKLRFLYLPPGASVTLPPRPATVPTECWTCRWVRPW